MLALMAPLDNADSLGIAAHLLGAVAVVDVPVDDEHAAQPQPLGRRRLQHGPRRHGHVVEEACAQPTRERVSSFCRGSGGGVQKPIAQPHSAWWPGGRTTATPFVSSPRATASDSSTVPPAASSAHDTDLPLR